MIFLIYTLGGFLLYERSMYVSTLFLESSKTFIRQVFLTVNPLPSVLILQSVSGPSRFLKFSWSLYF